MIDPMESIPSTPEATAAFETQTEKQQPSSYKDIITQLATLKPFEYDRIRKNKAKELDIRLKTLDADVKTAQQESIREDSPFTDIEPYLEQIDPAQLLNDITDAILRFIVLDKFQARLAALWVSACWLVDVIHAAPIALINAPEKACGKTQLLTVLSNLSPRATQASGISPSVLFRMIEAYHPTLFIDEIETVLKDNDELRGLINAGHTRDSAYVWRSVSKGDDFEPKRFRVWGMKGIAGINAIKLAETVTSRSIIFELRRKKANEKVQRLREAEPDLFATLAAKLARFAEDYRAKVANARPCLPDELSDREQDNFEPLLSIADIAGGHWPETARKGALKLSDAAFSVQSTANELLTSIQEIFEKKKIDRISTTDLIKALCEDEENPWVTYNRGKPITPRQIARHLAGYEIRSKTIRISYETAKGFEYSQFEDAFNRYLSHTPPNYPSQGNNPLKANNDNGFDVTESKSVTVTEKEKVTPELAPVLDCDVVTENSGVSGREYTQSSHLRI